MKTNSSKYQHLDSAMAEQNELIANATDENGIFNQPIPLHKDFTIHDIKEIDQPCRNHYRGAYDTSNIESFIQYSKDNKQEGTACFINPDNVSAVMLFDLGLHKTPLHCLHKATNRLIQTAAFKSLTNINDCKNSQSATAEWLEEWPENLSFTDQEGKKMGFSSAIAAIKNIKITAKSEHESKVSSTSHNRSALEEIDADANKNLPRLVTFNCVPFEGLEPRNFDMTLSVITSTTPQLILRIQQLEKHQEEIAEEFAEIIKHQLEGTEINTYIGNFNSK